MKSIVKERQAEITRETAETKISLNINLDGEGKSDIDTGCGFLNHMLTLFAKHSKTDLTVKCTGDIDVDYHHTTEDIGICMGSAFKEALGDMRGIERYASIILPMDEALIMCAIDVSGRGHLEYNVNIPSQKIGDFDTELTQEFFLGFVRNAGLTLHIKQLSGTNSHHITEGIFKAFAHTASKAVKINEQFKNDIPSTKGVL